MDGSSVILAAHRGEKKHHPENTMPAFIAAYEAGADMIETDIRMTRDGELILMHDASALRTCGVDAKLNDMTLDDVRQLDAGAVFDERFRGTRVPTVREFLRWVESTGMMVNWELKDYPCDVGEVRAFACADQLIGLIRECRMEKRSMLNSFSNRVLEYCFQKAGHDMPLHGQGIFNCRRSKDEAAIPETELFDWCCLYPKASGESVLNNPEAFDFCRDHGILPCIVLPDTMEAYRTALEWGVRMFTSNDILSADQVLRKLGVRA